MNAFPAEIQFRYTWRDYQQRVLSELDKHFDDGHLHIVAAPGSGKTVLGLEVTRRLNKPALVFTPTTAIRDQWVDRLVGLFCEPGSSRPDWISTDVRNPLLFTVCTYQALHSAFSGAPATEDEGEEESKKPSAGRMPGRNRTLMAIRDAGTATIVFDEAHHLRNEWWKCLIDVKEHLEDPAVVALTATPPYDVSPAEWDRYCQLCGPIDSVISVPELVATEDLCPHQDCVYISAPLSSESEVISEFRQQVKTFTDDLLADEAFTAALESHPYVDQPKAHAEKILSDPAFYASMAFYLNLVRGKPPKGLLRAVGYPHRKCPALELDWLETLLNGCLYSHRGAFSNADDLFDRLDRRLKSVGAIERRKVSLRSTSAIAKLLMTSASKLNSIEQIVRVEAGSCLGELRMVILTDYIRRDELPTGPENVRPPARMGVVPIFEKLRRADIPTARLGILTGSMVVIPQDARPQFEDIVADMKIGTRKIRYDSLTHDPDYCAVEIAGSGSAELTRVITRLFGAGGVNVLVGTASLLGEGWDAPSVNSLILASYVGSFMLSNQMRGRAIRTQRDNPSKTANIWHLLCVEQDEPEPSDDMELLARRFKAFVGVSFKKHAIESGIDRLALGAPPFTADAIDRLNDVTVQRARNRDALKLLWQRALEEGPAGTIVEEVTTSPLALPRKSVFINTIPAALWQVLFWGLFGAICLVLHLTVPPNSTIHKVVFWTFAAACTIGSLAMLPRLLKALWLLLGHRSDASSMKHTAKAVLKSLARADLLETRRSKFKIVAESQPYANVSCSLRGGTTYERSLILDALQQTLASADDPRYILIGKSLLLSFLTKNYQTVPQVLAKNKTFAENFQKRWSAHVGPTKLVYTRKDPGRKTLLRLKARELSTDSQRKADRTLSWQ